MPIVSIIMPAFNAEESIAESINSAINQTFPDFELIIIDDGSTDKTYDIAKGFAQTDNRIKVISQINSGVSIARNTGINNAIGKYIAFLDSDDLYLDSFLEKMVNTIESEMYDAVYCGFKNIKDNIDQGYPYADGNILEAYAQQNQRIWIVTFIIKIEFLKKYNIRFTPGVSMGEDQEFIGLCGIHCRIKAVPEILAVYQYNPKSASNDLSFKKRKEDILARDRVLEQIEKNFTSPYKKEVITYFTRIRNELMRTSKKIVWKEIKQGQLHSAYTKVTEFGNFENVAEPDIFKKQIEVTINQR